MEHWFQMEQWVSRSRVNGKRRTHPIPIRDAQTSASVQRVLVEGFGEIGLATSSRQLEQLTDLSEGLAHWAARINLTAHRGPEQVARRLILDAGALLAALPEFGSLADLGSGAGFPGLPIAILRPESRVTLVEAREKRHHFQRSMIRELGVQNAEPLRGRIEELEPSENSAVVAQAVGPQAQVVGWMLRWAREGAWLILPAGEDVPAESPHDQAIFSTLVEYQVPLGGPLRRVWLARRAWSSGHP